jgi:hypothetical protein
MYYLSNILNNSIIILNICSFYIETIAYKVISAVNNDNNSYTFNRTTNKEVTKKPGNNKRKHFQLSLNDQTVYVEQNKDLNALIREMIRANKSLTIKTKEDLEKEQDDIEIIVID